MNDSSKSPFQFRLKDALSARNMKASSLAAMTQIPKSAISQYLSGYSKPKAERITKLSNALQVNEAWLLGYHDVPMDSIHGKFPSEMGYGYMLQVDALNLAAHLKSQEPLKLTAQLLLHFQSLNQLGQQEALKRVQELSEISKYQCKDKSFL